MTVEADIMHWEEGGISWYDVEWPEVRLAFQECPACIVFDAKKQAVEIDLEYLSDLDENNNLFYAADVWASIHCLRGDEAQDVYIASMRRGNRPEGEEPKIYYGLGSYENGTSFVFNTTIEDLVRETEYSVAPKNMKAAKAWGAAHELGHQFNLVHHHATGYIDCVMQNPFESEPPYSAVRFWTLRCRFCADALSTIEDNIDNVKDILPPEGPPE
jgi:hypothetical protein